LALGLPDGVRGCLFDMDGVLTRTATVHAAAWKQVFDEFLLKWGRATGKPTTPFTTADYETYVDGRSRADGTRAFLASRGITLPEGTQGDRAGAATVQGLSEGKNEILTNLLATRGVDAFEDAVDYVRAVKAGGIPRAVVSASANTAQVLAAARISDLFDVRIDGIVAADRHLAGKPAPDMYLAAAEALGLRPEQAAVFEDALAGVEAGRAGRFGLVVGVDRIGHGGDLVAHGADLAVTDLRQLLEPA
jgi:beta-phosphoglucomutase family hydrolase